MLKLDNYSNYILKDISLKIDNQNLLILGANGSGKTTLAKILSGLISNNLILDGDERTKLINYIPVGLDIFDEFIDVTEFLKLNCLYSNLQIDEILKLFEITYLRNKSCKDLSSGESQLVLIAGAILHNAKYTIFDEPTSNLDPYKIKLVYDHFKQDKYLQHKIIITHNLNLAFHLEYDILFLENGQIKFYGSNDNFFTNDNLNIFFKGSVAKIENNIVVQL